MEMVQVSKPLGFIEKHGLWSDEQRRQAAETAESVSREFSANSASSAFYSVISVTRA